jgi:hypothetical protein
VVIARIVPPFRCADFARRRRRVNVKLPSCSSFGEFLFQMIDTRSIFAASKTF